MSTSSLRDDPGADPGELRAAEARLHAWRTASRVVDGRDIGTTI